MFVSDTTVHMNAYMHVPPRAQVGYALTEDDQVEISVGERSRVLDLFDGVTLVFEEHSLEQVVEIMTEALAELRAQRG
ncbi:hypothetical protein ACFFQW_16345 [Umezawaea endophytica]|uniref:Uncharacterized protein n=1 Tax=Umezawaea endophytica TaxID=1654476 RepID=A0A9X2VT15_9PSEU|nr:hypothetical protein [Umezawaea endophytica]MCS7481569.1 hypothetical protein [Umezawaea endophytica]